MDKSNHPLDWTIPLTLGTAGLAGFLAGHLLGNRRRSAKAIQKIVVTDLQREGELVGSWIDRQLIPYQRFDKKALAYQGGFRQKRGQQVISYRFLADATTGALLEMERED